MVVGTSRSATGRASKRSLASATRSIAGGSKGCSEDGCRRAFKRRRLRKKKIRQLFSTAQTRGGRFFMLFPREGAGPRNPRVLLFSHLTNRGASCSRS